MGLLSAKSVDDRGRKVELYPIPAWRPWWIWKSARADRDEVLDELIRRIKSQVQNEWKRMRPRTLVMVFAMIVLMTAWQWLMAFVAGNSRIIAMLSFYLAAVLLGLLMFKLALQDTSRALTNTFLGEGRCPCCGYSLTGAVVHPDNCVGCSECGAAWRADRLRNTSLASSSTTRPRTSPTLTTTRADRFIRRGFGQRVVLDADGRLIPLVHPRLHGLPADRVASIGPERLTLVRQDLARVNVVMRTIGAIGLLLLAAVQVALIILIRRSSIGGQGGVYFMALFAINIVQFAAYAWFMIVGLLYTNPAKCAAVMMSRGICPGCASPLDGPDLGASDRLACTHCQTAWKVPPQPPTTT